jgi:hypothetical protein
MRCDLSIDLIEMLKLRKIPLVGVSVGDNKKISNRLAGQHQDRTKMVDHFNGNDLRVHFPSF